MKRLLLITLITVAPAAAAASDWQIIPAGICAKDEVVCREALAAIAAGKLWPDLRGQKLECQPSPGCFPASSNCIAGFNCPSGGPR